MQSGARHAGWRWAMVLGLLLHGAAGFAMTRYEAAHLLRRTGFAPSPAEIDAIQPLAFGDAVDLILFDARGVAITPAPAWSDDAEDTQRKAVQAAPDEAAKQAVRQQFQRERREQAQELKAWWYREMLETPTPFTERMTLFWHNHFTSSMQKVKSPALLYRQNVLLRAGALGNLRDLTQAVAKDPAMLIYLDNTSNRKGAPNENFARELLELFTLGEGHYSEEDVKQAARAFTGWHVNRPTGAYTFIAGRHDYGVKAFMGRSGELDGEDVIEIVFEQEQVAPMIVGKLWREFISPTPDAAEVARLSELFRREKYAIKPLMRALLLSPAFRDEANRGALIKSPVELSVGLVRTFGMPIEDTRQLVRYGRELGQDLFDPPNVKGWEGGEAWIDSNTLLARRQMIERALRGGESEQPMRGGSGMNMEAAAEAPRDLQVAQADAMEMMEAQPMSEPAPETNDQSQQSVIERLRQRRLEEQRTGKLTPLPDRGELRREALRNRDERGNFGSMPQAGASYMLEWAMRLPGDAPSVEELTALLLAVPPALADPPAQPVGEAVRSLVLDPAYQLK